jgi:hypothetical protein
MREYLPETRTHEVNSKNTPCDTAPHGGQDNDWR